MKQNKAGYYIESLTRLFKESEFEKISGILKQLSYFNTEISEQNIKSKDKINPVFAVISNIISRGLPAPASCFIEDIFLQIFSETSRKPENGKILYNFNTTDSAETIFRSFFVNSCFNDSSQTEKLKNTSKFKEELVNKIIPASIGKYVIPVLCEGITYKSVLEKSDLSYSKSNNFDDPDFNFINDEIDFIIEFPYEIRKKRGIIIEIDPEESNTNTDYLTLNKKKKLAQELKYEFINIKKGQHEEAIQNLLYATYNEYFDILKKNSENPLSGKTSGLDAMQIVFSPFAAARIQKIINDHIINGVLDIKSKVWKIAVIERDIPGATLAVEELRKLYENISVISGQNLYLPKIELSIFYSKEFSKAKLYTLFQGQKLNIRELDIKEKYDLLIDTSVLCRKFPENLPENSAKNTAIIRSVHYTKEAEQFLSVKPIKYINFINNPKVDEYRLTDIKDSLNWFLKNIFRKTEFRENQFTALNKILQFKNSAYTDVSGSGKSLVYKFAAILQSGTSIVVQPDGLLLKEQYQKLKNTGFSGVRYLCTNEINTAYETETLKKLAGGQVQILFLSPEKLKENSFVEFAKKIDKSKFSLNYLVVDEAHIISEYGNDFRSESGEIYERTNKLFNKNKNNNPCTIALSSITSYDIQEDIKRNLHINHQDYFIADFKETKVDFSTIITYEGEKSLKKVSKIIEKSAKNKHKALQKLLEKIENENENHSTIIFCADKKGHFGVYSKDKTGVTNIIKENFNYREPAVIEPVTEIITNTALREKNYYNFKNGDNKIIVADKELGTGLDIKADNIIFFNLPDSIETLYQAIGRTGNKPKAKIYFLLDDSATEIFDFTDYPRVGGEIETIEEASELIPDVIALRRNVRKQYPGRKKEQEIFNELLSTIKIPETTPSEIIGKHVKIIFGENIELVSTPVVSPDKIAVNTSSGTFGYIDYDADTLNIKNSTFDDKISIDILLYIKSRIAGIFDKKENIFTEIHKPEKRKTTKGIEKVLSELKTGEETQIKFQLKNNVFGEILNTLRTYISEDFNDENLKDAFDNNSGHIGFIEQLNKIKRTNFVSLTVDVPILLEKLFYKYRDAKHTKSALYKLKVLNIIEDYTLSQEQESVTIIVKKKSPEHYKKALFNHIEKFISQEEVRLIKDNFDDYYGKTPAQKAVNYLINYTYDNIAEKKYNSIDEVVKFVKVVGQLENNPIIRKKKINEFFKIRRDRAYLNPIFSPGLLLDTNNLKKSSFELVREYIRRVGNLKDRREHLNKSTEKILETQTDNYTILLLNAYTLFWSESLEEQVFERAYSQMYKGFDLMQEKEKIDYKEILQRRNIYLESLYSRNSLLKDDLDPLIQLKIQTTWLENFNKNFSNLKK